MKSFKTEIRLIKILHC